jgi:hypothetical protein
MHCLRAVAVYIYNLHGKSTWRGRVSGRCSLGAASIKIHEEGTKKNEQKKHFPA